MTVGNLGLPEILIIAGVIILLFGAKKLPEMARSIGKSAKAFKEETKDLRDKGDAKDETPAAPPVQQQLPQAQPQAQAPTNGVQPAQTNGTEQQPVEQQNKNA
jgi:sec-independent protein translocase protein TatA